MGCCAHGIFAAWATLVGSVGLGVLVRLSQTDRCIGRHLGGPEVQAWEDGQGDHGAHIDGEDRVAGGKPMIQQTHETPPETPPERLEKSPITLQQTHETPPETPQGWLEKSPITPC